MSGWERFWYGPVAAVRPALLARFVLAVLAFDCWLELASHGARYGVGGFNVAHFPWLQFVPTPGFYVGLVTLCGIVALTQALYRPHRIGLVVVFATYTLAWSCSMLDSYQHHYLISLLLACFIFFPLHRAGKRVSAPAYVVAGVTCAIVYFYTAVTKLEPDWREGHALHRLIKDERGEWLAGLLGMEVEALWPLLAVGAIAVQLVTCAGFLWAITQDRTRTRRQIAPAWLGRLLILAPLSFHIGTEWIGLRIGWFSYYMIGIALVFFSPARWLESVIRGLAVPERSMRRLGKRLMRDDEDSGEFSRPDYGKQSTAFYASMPILVVAAMTSTVIDIPGAKTAAAAAALVVLVIMGLELYSTGVDGAATSSFQRSLAFGAACLALVASATFTEMRFDYYRWAGGDHRTREDYVTALRMYEKANAYAPPGQNRKAKMNEMREKVRALGLEAKVNER